MPGYVDVALVNGELVAQAVDDLQCQPRPITKARELFRRLLRKIVTDPAPIGLRHDDVAGETLLVLRKQPDARAENIAEAQLF